MDTFKKLASDIAESVKSLISKAKFNKMVRGRITASLGSNRYEVLINGNTYTVRSHFSHAINDRVVIVVCNNNWNELYVLY